MNTFGSDLAKILSAREQAHTVVGVTADVPVIKADTITKADHKETEPKETESKETESKETEPKETEPKESEV